MADDAADICGRAAETESCVVCWSKTPTSRCSHCKTPVCDRHCMRLSWRHAAAHRMACAALSVIGMKRQRPREIAGGPPAKRAREDVVSSIDECVKKIEEWGATVVAPLFSAYEAFATSPGLLSRLDGVVPDPAVAAAAAIPPQSPRWHNLCTAFVLDSMIGDCCGLGEGAFAATMRQFELDCAGTSSRFAAIDDHEAEFFGAYKALVDQSAVRVGLHICKEPWRGYIAACPSALLDNGGSLLIRDVYQRESRPRREWIAPALTIMSCTRRDFCDVAACYRSDEGGQIGMTVWRMFYDDAACEALFDSAKIYLERLMGCKQGTPEDREPVDLGTTASEMFDERKMFVNKRVY